MRKIFTFLCAALMSVGMWATTVVTITQDDFPKSGNSFTKYGVTVSAGNMDSSLGNLTMGGSFSTTLGNFTEIEVTANNVGSMYGPGWHGNPGKMTWIGNAASSVSFGGNIMGNGQGVTLKFTIAEPTVAVTGVTLNQNEAQMTVGGETLTLTATVLPNNATNKGVMWSSDNGDVATVDNGVVTAVAAGNATITVTTTDGSFTATCDVTVTAPEPEPAGEVTVVFAANNKTVEKTVTLPHDFSCSYENKDGELDAIIQELYEISAGHCSDDNYPVASGNAAVLAGSNGFDNYITISAAFEGTATVSGWYWNSDAYDGDGDWMDYSLTISIKGDEPEPAGIGPREEFNLGTSSYAGEHYQVLGEFSGSSWIGVGGNDNKTITVESLNGEIIDNITLKVYFPSSWTGYSIASTSGTVSGDVANYQDLVITGINATSVTLSRVGEGNANGSVSFHRIIVNDNIAPTPEPQPVTDPITPYADPQDASVYYSTFYDSNFKYELPAGVEAYVADLSGANLLLTKIAEAGEVIPANNAVILKSSVTPFTLTKSDAAAVTFTATNDLQGSDVSIATPANCYVLAGTDGVVGFYHYTAANLNAHKAYVVYSGSNQAPRRMPFIFDQATGVENVQGDNVQSTKVIENGVLFIIKNGVKYNAQGQMIK